MLALYFFLTQAAAGSLVAMTFVPVKAAGKLFFRFGAAMAAALIALSLGIAWWGGGLPSPGGPLLSAAVAVLLLAAGLFHLGRVGTGFAVVLAGMALSLAVVAADAWLVLPSEHTEGADRFWLVLDGLVGGLVTGSVLMAMVLGHYYLNIPGLPVRHLERLTLLCMGAIAARAGILAVTLTIHRGAWLQYAGIFVGSEYSPPIDGPADPFTAVLLVLQILAGILVPFVFCVMAWRSAKIASTQSATGILYVALIVVMMGELAARSVVLMTQLPI